MDKDLILGTAMWGWKIEKNICFQLLDKFYDKGFRCVDTATNYPINNSPKSFRDAENIIAEWININGISDLKIIMKIGSVDNSGGSKNNLSFSYLLMNKEYYISKFHHNLWMLMVHWDNRKKKERIMETVNALTIFHKENIGIGLSGIKYPEIYYNIFNDKGLKPSIECKHNLYESHIDRYRKYFTNNIIYTYGANMGGLNLKNEYSDQSSIVFRCIDSSKYCEFINRINSTIAKYNNELPMKITTLNQLSLIEILFNDQINGLIIAPSKLNQLNSTLSDYEILSVKILGDSKMIFTKIFNEIRNKNSQFKK